MKMRKKKILHRIRKDGENITITLKEFGDFAIVELKNKKENSKECVGCNSRNTCQHKIISDLKIFPDRSAYTEDKTKTEVLMLIKNVIELNKETFPECQKKENNFSEMDDTLIETIKLHEEMVKNYNKLRIALLNKQLYGTLADTVKV